MPLKPDNPIHRQLSNSLDAKFTGNFLYDKLARPVGHGIYHAGRSVDTNQLTQAAGQLKAAGSGIADGAVSLGTCVIKLNSEHCSVAKQQLTPVLPAVVESGKSAFRSFSEANKEELARAKDQFSKIGTGQQHSEYLKAYLESENKKQ